MSESIGSGVGEVELAELKCLCGIVGAMRQLLYPEAEITTLLLTFLSAFEHVDAIRGVILRNGSDGLLAILASILESEGKANVAAAPDATFVADSP